MWTETATDLSRAKCAKHAKKNIFLGGLGVFAREMPFFMPFVVFAVMVLC